MSKRYVRPSIISCIALSVLIFVSIVVVRGSTIQFDQSILRMVNDISSPILDTISVTLTQLGGFLGVVTITVGAILILLLRKKHIEAVFIAVSISLCALTNVLLKQLFERSRPELWEQLIHEMSFSFPSGHAMMSAALAFSLVFLVWRTSYRLVPSILAGIYVILIGCTRIYLGVHYPSDILAGWAASAAIIASIVLGFRIVRRWSAQKM